MSAPFASAEPRRIAELPGPGGVPFLGRVYVPARRLHRVLESWAARYGSVFASRVFGQRVVTFTDPEAIESVLRSRPDGFRRFAPVEPIFDEVGARGLFSVEGLTWRGQRHLVLQAFAQRHLKNFFPLLEETTRRLASRWQRHGPEASIDIVDDFMRFTLDVTTRLTFGVDLDTLGSDGAALQQHLRLVFPAFAKRLSTPLPYWRLFRFPADRRLDRALTEIRLVQERVLTEARARLEARRRAAPEAELEPTNLLEGLLLARDETGAGLSEADLHGNMLTMLLAGEDTTSHTLGWLVHLLCEHPEAIERARAEVDPLLGDALTPSDVELLPSGGYVDGIVAEAMRLYPVAAVQSHEALEDVVIGGVRIPRGVLVTTLARPANLDARHFARPGEFLPERWLADSTLHPHSPRVSAPFGSGPRICPGRALALLEMRLVVALLVHSFELERVGEAAAVEDRWSFVVTPVGLRVRLRPRVTGGAASTRRRVPADAVTS
jgi:cytochrome P450